MDKKVIFGRSIKDLLLSIGPTGFVIALAVIVAYRFIDPAPPNHLVISTSDGEGDYQTYAKLYQEILKEDGINLEIRDSSGAMENLQQLQKEDSDIQVGFVQDGLGSPDQDPDLNSLGSLYYEPFWVFYRGSTPIARLAQLEGKKIAIGRDAGGTRVLALKLFSESGLTDENSQFLTLGGQQAADALRAGKVDAAVFLATVDDPLIENLAEDKRVKLMSFDQAEATTRQVPFLHHVVLSHGTIDIKNNIPDRDIDLVSPTATLLAKDTVHPALIFLLLKAATQVHGGRGLIEKKGEFPSDKDSQFPLAEEAKAFYKSGTPFWQRFLPFWLATLIERFILLVIPVLALIIPAVRLIPKIYTWRIRSRIYQRYGELKYLETAMRGEAGYTEHVKYLDQLDSIEERVNAMKVPLDFSDHIYVLREHIDFVRGRIAKALSRRMAHVAAEAAETAASSAQTPPTSAT